MNVIDEQSIFCNAISNQPERYKARLISSIKSGSVVPIVINDEEKNTLDENEKVFLFK